VNSFFKRLLTFTRDGLYRYRFDDGVVLQANRGLLEILDVDLTPEAAVGQRISDLIQYTEKPGEIRRLLAEHGEIHGYEYHFQTRKGDDRWVLHDSFLVDDPESGQRIVEAIVKDITPLRKAAQKIDEERERLAVTLRSIGDALIATDAQGRVVLMNPVAELMTGWPLGLASGLPLEQVFKIVHEITRNPLANPVSRVIATGQTVALANHTTLIARDGKEWFISDSAAPIRNNLGAVIGVVLVFRDVGEEKRMLQALRRSEERYRLLFNGMLDGFALHEIICDPEGNPVNYRFLEINPRFEEMTGLHAKDLLGRTVRDALPETDSEWIQTYGKVALTGIPVHFERFSAELNRYFEVTAYRPAAGQFVTIIMDVTERRKAEEDRKKMESQLQQIQKLESLGVLAGGIAHDFNNLLTGVLGNASLALLDVPDGTPAFDSLKQIELSAQRAADLCRQLLAYSGKGRFVVEPIDLSELVEEMANLLQISITKKAVLKYALARHLPAISADVTQLRQIVMNLIVNASEAIGEQSGVIAITTGAMDCDRAYLKSAFMDGDLPEGVYVYVEVSDTGCGMDPSIMARIFDPFYSTKFAGRGLGLAAILGIVRSHKGTIKVYSEKGRGSSFKILFPTVEETPVRHETDAGLAASAHLAGTILVADDDETIRSLARRTLERVGLQVLTARDGREAVEMYRLHAERIRLVLLDMTMPHMSGEEVFREIRRIRSDCRVILSSGYNESDATSRFSGKGLAGFIQKPYRQADLIAKVGSVLSEESGIPGAKRP
jgi:two-component system, cell cycle sensor histidine kinase and response regulator CckA